MKTSQDYVNEIIDKIDFILFYNQSLPDATIRRLLAAKEVLLETKKHSSIPKHTLVEISAKFMIELVKAFFES